METVDCPKLSEPNQNDSYKICNLLFSVNCKIIYFIFIIELTVYLQREKNLYGISQIAAEMQN